VVFENGDHGIQLTSTEEQTRWPSGNFGLCKYTIRGYMQLTPHSKSSKTFPFLKASPMLFVCLAENKAIIKRLPTQNTAKRTVRERPLLPLTSKWHVGRTGIFSVLKNYNFQSLT